MKIELWYDFVCPFCYLGERKLELALEQFEHSDEVELILRSYELQMGNTSTAGKNIHQVVADKYHVSYESAKANNDRITLSALEVGLHYDFDNMKLNSSRLAHQLAHFAGEQGKEHELVREYFKGYFEEGMDIGDKASLFERAEKIGLSLDGFEDALASGRLDEKVDKDEADAMRLGIDSIPHFIIDQQYVISGSQSPEYLLSVLRQVYKESK